MIHGVMHPHAALQNLNYNHSDHRPLLVDTDYYAQVNEGGNNVKCFEARWLRENAFADIVQEAWQEVGTNPSLSTVQEKLDRMHGIFHDWDQRVLKKPKKRFRRAQKELEKVMTDPITDESEKKRKELAELIEFLLELEEIHYMQRSRANWLKFGNRNTGFFQAYASARRKKNLIKNLKDTDGNIVEGTVPLSEHIQNYFNGLFSSEVQQVDRSKGSRTKLCVECGLATRIWDETRVDMHLG